MKTKAFSLYKNIGLNDGRDDILPAINSFQPTSTSFTGLSNLLG